MWIEVVWMLWRDPRLTRREGIWLMISYAAYLATVTGRDPTLVVEALPRQGRGLWQRRHLLEGEVGRLDRER